MAGNYEKAIEIWTKVLAKSPKNFLIQRNIEEAQAHLKEQQSGGAHSKVLNGTEGQP